MSPFRAGARAVLFMLFILVPGCGHDLDEPAVALVGGLLIDGTGAPPLEDGVVVIRGSRIEAAGSRDRVPIPADATIHDVSGRTVMPGMVEGNSHVTFSGQSEHLEYFVGRVDRFYEIGARNLHTSLMQGITTSRDTMGSLDVLLRLREDVASGRLAGSRLLTCGTILNYLSEGSYDEDRPDLSHFPPDQVRRMREGHVRPVRDGAHGREVVREKASLGVDFIKVSAHSGPGNDPPVLSEEDLAEIVEEAHTQGLPVTTHTGSVESVRTVVGLGVDAMEHPTAIDTAHIAGGEGWEFPDDLIEEIVSRDVYSIPMLLVVQVYVTFLENPELLDDPRYVRHAPADMVQEARDWLRTQLADDPGVVDRYRVRYEVMRRNLGRLIEAGAPIAMGTDKGTRLNFHESANHVRELQAYVELGMTPMDAIISATRRGAELAGLDHELGTIEAGKIADVIVVDGNPLDDLDALYQVSLVFKEGVRYK